MTLSPSATEAKATPAASEQRPRRWLRLAPLALLALLALLAWRLGWFSLFSFETLKQHRAWLEAQVSQNYLLVVVLFILLYTAVAGFPVAIWMSLTGGFLFGPWFGALFSVIGATLGAALWFLAVKTAFGDVLRQRAGGVLGRLSEGFNADAFSYLLTLRLIPVVPFSVVNIAASLLGMRLPAFLLATFIGIIPGGLVYNALGSSVSGLIERGEAPDLGTIFEPRYLLPLVGLGLLALLPVVYRRVKARRALAQR